MAQRYDTNELARLRDASARDAAIEPLAALDPRTAAAVRELLCLSGDGGADGGDAGAGGARGDLALAGARWSDDGDVAIVEGDSAVLGRTDARVIVRFAGDGGVTLSVSASPDQRLSGFRTLAWSDVTVTLEAPATAGLTGTLAATLKAGGNAVELSARAREPEDAAATIAWEPTAVAAPGASTAEALFGGATDDGAALAQALATVGVGGAAPAGITVALDGPRVTPIIWLALGELGWIVVDGFLRFESMRAGVATPVGGPAGVRVRGRARIGAGASARVVDVESDVDGADDAGGGLVVTLDVRSVGGEPITAATLLDGLLGSGGLAGQLAFLDGLGGLRGNILAAGLEELRGRITLGSGDVEVYGRGRFVGQDGALQLRLYRSLGERAFALTAWFDDATMSLGEAFDRIGVDLGDAGALLPLHLRLGLRQVELDEGVRALRVYGTASDDRLTGDDRWELDLAVALGGPDGLVLQLGRVERDAPAADVAPPRTPTLADVARALSLPIDRAVLADLVPGGVVDKLLATRMTLVRVRRDGAGEEVQAVGRLADQLEVSLSYERTAAAADGSAPAGWALTVEPRFAHVELRAALATLGFAGDHVDHLPSFAVALEHITIDQRAGRAEIGVGLAVNDREAELVLAIEKQGGFTFAPTLRIGALTMRVDWVRGGAGGDSFTASIDDTDGALTLSQLTTALGLDVGDLPFDLALRSASFTWQKASSAFALAAAIDLGDDRPAGAAGDAALRAAFASELMPAAGGGDERVYVARLAIGHALSAARLPVVGSMLAEDALALAGLRLTLASRAVEGADADKLLALLDRDAAAPAATGPSTTRLAAGATLEGELRLAGAKPWPIALGIPTTPATAASAASPAAAAAAASGVPAGPAPASDGAKWLTVGKSVGPLRVDRVGLRYRSGELSVLFDAGLSFAGLTLRLDGLGATSPLDRFRPVPELRGLGLAMQAGPLTVGGAFTKLPDDVYGGAVIVGVRDLALTALGAYKDLDVGGGRRKSSVFLYLRLSAPLGGPPCFFVTGLAGGFGYNFALRVPGEDEVTRFPLLPGGPALPDGAMAMVGRLLSADDRSRAWLTPADGEYWLAAGLSFRSFELLETTAVAVASFGGRFEVTLLGVSSLTLPRAPAGAPPVTPLVDLRLGLRAHVAPDDGVLATSARLDPASFVLDPQCKLQGGFAFCTWFDARHRGDFVVTLGGYHPRFHKPDHYPDEPRVSFAWQRTPQLSLKGSLYAALTPAALMAGGSLSAVFEQGALRAWFEAWADFLVEWKPLRYQISIGVSIGASYRVRVLGIGKTIRVGLGASLELWGPPFAGRAHVRWYVLSFTVELGNSAAPPAAPLDWSDFAATFLPAPAVPGCWASARAAGGLIAVDHDAPAGAPANSPTIERWVMSAGALRVVTRTSIPATEVTVQGHPLPLASSPPALGVRPMRASGLRSVHAVSFERWLGGERWEPLPHDPARPAPDLLRFTVVHDAVPTAVWSPLPAAAHAAALPATAVIDGVPVGVEISLAPVDLTTVASVAPFDLGAALYAGPAIERTSAPAAAESTTTALLAPDARASEAAVHAAMASVEARRAREQLARAAGVALDERSGRWFRVRAPLRATRIAGGPA